jgi:Flp pilus assembly pilin Flp
MRLLVLINLYLHDIKAVTVIEYCMIGAGISLAMAAAAFAFGDQLDSTYQQLEARLVEAHEQVQ